jgi:hypothetical protein
VIISVLQKRIALRPVLADARRRLAIGQKDGSELYEGELASAVEAAVAA